ncbi:ribonuclease P protein component [Halospina denitrificans]|uniref:Ribonuclease P protein component n=1 Tax=Halospina denitrificans TaxID=332522 RepID=A0A4R7K2D8_9GAMM|nr:ribonuclease P protein component [Halospina denitrificans]TDT44073.1 ribonuclease P protein component [Halospina denitrificans]
MTHDNRFPRQARLLNSRAYTQVFSDVQFKTGNRHLLMLATQTRAPEPSQSRLGIIVARKHLKRAVDRNRIKRLVRESFRHRQNDIPSLDVIVLARPGIGTLDNQQLYQQLDRLWSKLSHQVDSTSL